MSAAHFRCGCCLHQIHNFISFYVIQFSVNSIFALCSRKNAIGSGRLHKHSHRQVLWHTQSLFVICCRIVSKFSSLLAFIMNLTYFQRIKRQRHFKWELNKTDKQWKDCLTIIGICVKAEIIYGKTSFYMF